MTHERSEDGGALERRPPRPRASASSVGRSLARGIIEYGLAFVSYAAVVAAFMWPVARAPFDHIPEPRRLLIERPDQDLIMWILSWNWHALFSNPGSVFDANILHPARGTLAGAEHLFGITPLYGLFYQLTGNPVFALNATQISTLALCGVAMYALLRHWGVIRLGALFGGFVYAVHPDQIHGSASLQLLSRQYLPLALVFLDRTLRGERIGSAVALAVLVVWQMLCSVYLAFISAISLVVYACVLVFDQRRSLSARGFALAAGAAIVVAAVLIPIHLPYLARISEGVIADHSLTDRIVVFSSGLWENWLTPPILLRARDIRMGTGLPTYVGVLPLCAAGLVLAFRRRESSSWAVPASLAILLAGYVLALGPSGTLFGRSITLPYGHLAEWIPGFSSMRVPSRFAIATMTGLSALAGIGLGRALGALVERGTPRWLTASIAVATVALTALEYDLPLDPPRALRVPVGDAIPPVYSALRELPPGPLLELPWAASSTVGSLRFSSPAMYFSTYHWNPLLNGYTSYPPPVMQITTALSRALPDGRAFDVLARTTGLRYVIVHFAEMPVPLRSRWTSDQPDLQLVGRFGPDLLFRLARTPSADLVDAMRDGPVPGRSVLGTPIEPVPEADRRADVRFTVPPPARSSIGSVVAVELEVHNPTNTTWPTLSTDPTDLVMLAHRVVTPDGTPVGRTRHREAFPGRLPYDLAGGERVRIGFWVNRPGEPGRYVLEVWLEQSGHRFAGSVLRQEVVFE